MIEIEIWNRLSYNRKIEIKNDYNDVYTNLGDFFAKKYLTVELGKELVKMRLDKLNKVNERR